MRVSYSKSVQRDEINAMMRIISVIFFSTLCFVVVNTPASKYLIQNTSEKEKISLYAEEDKTDFSDESPTRIICHNIINRERII